jgi:hypothetical protein
MMGSIRFLIALCALSLVVAPGATSLEKGKEYVPTYETAQGVYVENLTTIDSELAVAKVSTDSDTILLTVKQYVAGDPGSWSTVHSATIDGSEQDNAIRPWINAGWGRGYTLPELDAGLYTVEVPSGNVTPNNITLSHDTYKYPLFIASDNPKADFLLVSPSLTISCYNTWPNYTRFTATGEDGINCYFNPISTEVGPLTGVKRPGYDSKGYERHATLIDIIEGLGFTWEIVDELWLADNPDYMKNFRGVALIEQSEYATYEMREAYDSYIAGGGRFMHFSNETWIWNMRKEGDAYRVHKLSKDPYAYDSDSSNDNQITGYSVLDVTDEPRGPNNPEIDTLGFSFWMGGNPTAGAWSAYRTAHWMYEGTGLSDGGTFGDLVAYVDPANPGSFVDGVVTQTSGSLPYTDEEATYGIPTNVLILGTIATVNSSLWDCAFTPFATNASCKEAGTAAIVMWESGDNNGVIISIPDKRWFRSPGASRTRITENILTRVQAPGTIDVYDGFSTTP